MKRTCPHRTRRRRGVACLFALVLLAILSTLAVSMSVSSDMNVQKGLNSRATMNARLAAEGGLGFMLDVIRTLRLPGSTKEETFCTNLRKVLADVLEGTPNLAGAHVTNTGTSVVVPEIAVEGRTFRSCFEWIDGNRCRLTVRGSDGAVSRQVAVDLLFEAMLPGAFDYGLASRGPITISGNARIVGVNHPSEANVVSATTSSFEAIVVDGNCEVSGDLATADENTFVTLSGNPKIAGTTDPEEIAQHIHYGVGDPGFPEIDVAPIAALATYTLQPSDPTNKGVLSNVRIPAGANPTFSSDVVLNGVVYIESPNVVKFEGKCTLNGMVVTSDTGQPSATCELHFAGSVEANGVEALPDTPEFALVKQQTGTFICAPGFGVTFAGNFSAINGSIAADQLTFSGTAEGVVNGSVIGLKDLPTSIGGNVDILVDQQGADPNPVGFVKVFGLSPAPDSYAEVQGG